MARVLIAYESKFGQTEKISKFILDRLLSQGHSVDLLNISKGETADIKRYDGIIVGAGIYGSRYPDKISRFVKSNSDILNKKVAVFFSVCLTVMQQTDKKVQRDIEKIENKFFQKTGWSPTKHPVFAGALNYSKYNWIIKQMMRLISRAGGGETDVSRDYEYTNWNDVVRFSDDFSRSLGVGRERGAAQPFL